MSLLNGYRFITLQKLKINEIDADKVFVRQNI